MNNWRYIILLCLVGLNFSTIHSQSQIDRWSLDQCVAFALENNLLLHTTKLNLLESEIYKNQLAKNKLPSLNAAGTHGYNWGQSIDPFTNEFAAKRVRTNNIYLSSNWILFSGLQNYHLSQKTNAEISFQDYNQKVQKRNLKIDVTAHYLQVLLNNRKFLDAVDRVSYTQNLLEDTRVLIEANQYAEYVLLEIESQLALDSLAVLRTSNELKLSMLRLKQYLNIKPEDDFEILLDYDAYIPASELDRFEMVELFEIKQAEINEEIKSYNYKIAKGKRAPILSINSSLGSGYSGNNAELIDSELIIKPFNKQLNENFYQSLMLTLSIPIFNKGTVDSEIELSKIEMQKASIQKEQTILEVQSKIEQLKIEIENLEMQQRTFETALSASLKLLDIAKIKLDEGVIDFTDFLEVRRKYNEAQSDFLNAKFQLMFKLKIWGYYVE